eukprot:366199-Chlamydomonas_euryale.AAC.3
MVLKTPSKRRSAPRAPRAKQAGGTLTCARRLIAEAAASARQRSPQAPQNKTACNLAPASWPSAATGLWLLQTSWQGQTVAISAYLKQAGLFCHAVAVAAVEGLSRLPLGTALDMGWNVNAGTA